MTKKYKALILDEAAQYIQTMSDADQGATNADIDAMENGEFEAVSTKQLRGKVRELIVGSHRITYFLLGSFIYFVHGFKKKSAKTPVREINYAEQLLEIVKKQK